MAAATNQQLGRIAALEGELAEAHKQTDQVRATLAQQTVEQALRDAIGKQHVLESADGEVKTDAGLTAVEWLDARKNVSPYCGTC